MRTGGLRSSGPTILVKEIVFGLELVVEQPHECASPREVRGSRCDEAHRTRTSSRGHRSASALCCARAGVPHSGEEYGIELLNDYGAAWALIRQWAGHEPAVAQREAEIQRLERLVYDAVYALQK